MIPCGQGVASLSTVVNPKLNAALSGTSRVVDGDLTHVFTGLEAAECPSSTTKLPVGPSTWTVNMPNYTFATWGGDLGSAAAHHTADWRDGNPLASSWTPYFGTPGSDASTEDLLGDIDGLVLHFAANNSICSTTFTPTVGAMSGPLSKLLSDYYGDTLAPASSYRRFRKSCVAAILGVGTDFPAKTLHKYKDSVESFAQAWYVGVLKRTDILKARNQLADDSKTVTGLFADWLPTHAG